MYYLSLIFCTSLIFTRQLTHVYLIGILLLSFNDIILSNILLIESYVHTVVIVFCTYALINTFVSDDFFITRSKINYNSQSS